MQFIDKYLLSYAAVVLISGLALMAIDVSAIEVYYAVYLTEFLVWYELWASRRRSLERNLRPVAFFFIIGFLFTLAEEILASLH